MNTPIPTYAHPVPVSADGVRFRKVHGPRTLVATQRRARAGAEQARILAARASEPGHSPAEFLTVAR